MKYVTVKRFKRNGIDGYFNIPYGTEVEEKDGFVYFKGSRICSAKSAVMREYFAKNDDGCGIKRSELAHAIIDAMQIQNGESKEAWQKRWDVLWNDPISTKYKKDESDTTFIWSIDFFNGPLIDLWHIAALVGVNN